MTPREASLAAAHRLGRRNLVLVGFMGTGKTVVGQLLAERLNRRFCDIDQEVERSVGMSVAQLFACRGEAAFRDMEEQVVERLAGQGDLVVATGGGTLLRPTNRQRLQASGLLVALTARPEVILRRVGGAEAGRSRPLLDVPDPAGRIADLLREREPLYAVAAFAVDTSDRSPAEVAEAVLCDLAGSGVGGGGGA